jgi:hypothetical protein
LERVEQDRKLTRVGSRVVHANKAAKNTLAYYTIVKKVLYFKPE